MRRNTSRDAAARAGVMVTRTTVTKVNDDPRMQEVDVNGLHDELKTGVERVQNYGFSSVPLPPSQEGRAEGQSGDQQKMRHAEAVILSGTGNRSHPLVIAIDDRRHRPKKLKPGESAQYDDQGQSWLVGRDGIVGKAKKFTLQVGDNTVVTIEDGKVTIKGAEIVLDGNVKLGGAGASREVALKDSVDSDGDVMQSNLATKVKAL
ncbi:phage baseplate assembly protein domain-containing protein [Methylobacterium durans]|uniref:Bacteriophage Mu Gp45 N-terminal domain-containing protein n=1 Tax=Methylobacterium durans TaxID=2202825 RepID=A0A2U8WAI4_9HYPH|nr:phage baseplate assembly protein [Methylobacterium durans]AWN43173.1 hypothetical protein DK389_25095 [Methylobacterium durans]